MKNIAYIDGQNLYMGTMQSEPRWCLDLQRFRVYLQKKYQIEKAYYFLGFVQDGERAQRLYEEIQSAGFILIFKKHTALLQSKKKGNVDSEIIFTIMKHAHDKDFSGKVFLVTGDGDFISMVDYLIERKQFGKLLFPNRRFVSSLYKKLGSEFLSGLGDPGVKDKIEAKEKGSLGS